MHAWTLRATALTGILLACPATARAEWSLMAFLGASHTAPATLTLDQPAAEIRMTTFTGVPLASRSFSSPPYYGYRFGWFSKRDARAGIEAELIHLKVYAPAGSMGPLVERFSISHGLNLLLANVVMRQPAGRRVRLAARVGAGIAVPHAESRIGGIDQEQYEVTSPAFQASAGPEFALSRHSRAFAEYKLTTTAPTVSVANGTIRGRYTSQHLAAGIGVVW
jgi:hypothetical protein